ncbi:MAG: GNAT family N-acetyltransferase [Eubacterium sp.]|nr:GNAT family N-acetyltransferase [Eubacterium sp.]
MFNNRTKKLETERLVLRKFRVTDYFYMKKWYLSPYVCRYSQVATQKTKKDLIKFILSRIYRYIKNDNFYFWCMSLDGKPIGFIGFINMKKENYYSFYYTVSEEFSSKGYTTEGVKKIIEYMKGEDAEYLYASCDRENVASQKVMEKSGLEFYFDVPGDFHYPDGRIGDRLVYRTKMK